LNFKVDIPEELIEAIASRVIERICPFLQPLNEKDELLDMEQVCQYLGVKKQQVYQWVNKSAHGLGNFPYRKVGRSLRFSRKEMEAWVKRAEAR
jgi:excisionase family DNA binding protein